MVNMGSSHRISAVRHELTALKELLREGDEPKIIAAITGLSWDATLRPAINEYLIDIATDRNNSLNVRRHSVMAIDDPKALLTIMEVGVDPKIISQARIGLATYLD